MRWGCVFLLLITAGCASTDDDEDLYLNPNIPASAYASDAFTFYVEPPLHPEWDPVKFYFKDCDENGIGNHISRTSYSCTYP